MTRDLRISRLESGEPTKKLLAETVALFRMELDAHDTAGADPRWKWSAVVSHRPDVIITIAADPITVREVKALLI